MDNFCRCCARKNDNLSEINKKDNGHPENESALKMLQIFKQIEITNEDSLSKRICSECLLQLQNAFIFYMNIKKSQTILINLLDQIKRKTLPWILPKTSTVQYKCTLCAQLFETRLDLQNHIKKELLKRKRSCNLKEKRRKISSNVGKTKKKSLKQIHFKVEKLNDNKELSPEQIHFKIEQPKDDKESAQLQEQIDPSVRNFNNSCNFCNTIFSDSNEYKTHKASHSRYKCKKCLKEFCIQDNLIHHTQETYEDCLFYCNECKKDQDYQGEQELNEHIKESHHNQHQQSEEEKPQIKNDENKMDTMENDQDDSGGDDLFTDVEFLDEFFLNQGDNLHLNEYWENISFTFDDLNDKEVVFKEKTADCEGNNLLDDNENNTINYKCPKCKKSIRSQQELYIHLAHEHDEHTLICNSCSDTFNRIDDLKFHRKEKCLKIKGETFIDNNQFGNILIKSSSTSSDGKAIYKCMKCESFFSNQKVATNHDCKNKLNRIPCTFCLQLFPNLQKMYMHRKAVHFNELLHCKVCSKTFATMIGLKYHLKIHEGSKHYLCPYCSQKFTANINLSSHIKNVHCLSKAYVCNLCDTRFSTTNHLRKHVTSVHQKERNFLCNTCGKRYAQSSHLKQHELSHTDERKNVCSICTKGYIRAIDLMKHIKKMHPSTAAVS